MATNPNLTSARLDDKAEGGQCFNDSESVDLHFASAGNCLSHLSSMLGGWLDDELFDDGEVGHHLAVELYGQMSQATLHFCSKGTGKDGKSVDHQRPIMPLMLY